MKKPSPYGAKGPCLPWTFPDILWEHTLTQTLFMDIQTEVCPRVETPRVKEATSEAQRDVLNASVPRAVPSSALAMAGTILPAEGQSIPRSTSK